MLKVLGWDIGKRDVLDFVVVTTSSARHTQAVVVMSGEKLNPVQHGDKFPESNRSDVVGVIVDRRHCFAHVRCGVIRPKALVMMPDLWMYTEHSKSPMLSSWPAAGSFYHTGANVKHCQYEIKRFAERNILRTTESCLICIHVFHHPYY